MPTIKQLRYFNAVAQNGHFGRAAESCAISQPALSMQIKDLENELGVELIERRPSGIVLTATGRQIATRTAKILHDVRDLVDYAHHRGSTLSGTLHFGVIPTIAPYVLPNLLSLLKRAYPDLELHVRETRTETLLQQVGEGKLDVILLALPIDQSGIQTLPLIEDAFLLALPKGKSQEKRLSASSDLLENDRLLLLEEGHCLRDQALSFCELREVDNIETFGASSLSTIVQMVANDMGVTLLPEISIDVETRHGKLELVRFDDPQPSRTLGLAWRGTSPRAEEFTRLGEIVKQAMPRRTS